MRLKFRCLTCVNLLNSSLPTTFTISNLEYAITKLTQFLFALIWLDFLHQDYVLVKSLTHFRERYAAELTSAMRMELHSSEQPVDPVVRPLSGLWSGNACIPADSPRSGIVIDAVVHAVGILQQNFVFTKSLGRDGCLFARHNCARRSVASLVNYAMRHRKGPHRLG